MAGLKPTFKRFMNMIQVKEDLSPQTYYLLRKIYNLLEDVYSVSTVTEIQEAIDAIGTGAGTIFIASGTYEIDTTIDIDNCGSLVIYGHGDNTILEAAAGITIFNITCTQRCLIRTLKLDVTNYNLLAPDTQAIIINETNDNIVGFSDVTIVGDGSNGLGIEMLSNNCYIEQCNITDCKKGIYINSSDRHIISANIITGHADYGIHADTGNYLNIITNTCGSNGDYGIYLDTTTYSTLSGNICNSNSKTGIYCDSSTNNIISSNSCTSNSENGVYLTGCSYNTVSGNTLNSNDSSSITAKAGLYITTNSDFNTITGNTVNNNNNTGLGTGYGIYIATATCDENVVASNNANGNDVDFQDSGTATTITYYVQNTDELQDAIDSIGTKAGLINIDASFTVSTTIDIDGGGSYIIRGEGSNSTLTPDDDLTCFNITNARSVLLENFKIDVTAWTVAGRDQEIILITEAANNLVIIDNVEIDGNDYGYGIEANSDYVQIKNCKITNIYYGLRLIGDNCLVTENIITGTGSYGINVSGDYCMISHNTFISCSQAIQTDGSNYVGIDSNTITTSQIIAGVYLFNLTGANVSNNIITGGVQASGIFVDDSNYCTIIGNICDNNDDSSVGESGGIVIVGTSSYNNITDNTCTNSQNAGAEFGYGIVITDATCVENVVRSNSCSGNDITWKDVGTNSDFEYRCSSATEIQEAVDSIAAKAGTITINADTFAITTTIAVDGGGSYIIEGQGDNTILTPDVLTTVFRVSDAISCIIQNLKIDAQNLTGTTPAITIAEAADNKVIIDNITIEGDADLEGYGIQIDSPNCIVQNCRISLMLNGIVPTDESCIITGNICNSNGSYGIFLNSSNYITVTSNICNLNQIGIYITGVSTGNILLGNTIKSNTADGIYLNSSHQNTLEGNIIDGNITTNVATDHAGITLSHSDNNFIIGNTIINNVNGGAGEGYGVYIINATSEENIVRTNNISGNDIQWKDVGVNSDIEYRCSSSAEIQNAIDSIAAKSGTVHILPIAGGIQLSATIDVDGGGFYIIEGEGDGTVIDCAGDRTAFNITSAKAGTTLKNFKIDASDITTAAEEIIDITEGSNNKIIIENILVDGTGGLAGGKGVGVNIQSENVIIRSSKFVDLYYGIYALANYQTIIDNEVDGTTGGLDGIYLSNADYSIVSNNRCHDLNDGLLITNSASCVIMGNNCYDNGQSGMYIFQSDYCTVIGNIFNDNIYTNIQLRTSDNCSITGNIACNSSVSYATDVAAILIRNDANNNTITGNNCSDNTNTGAGDFIGIEIQTADCDDNLVSSNVLENNDVNYSDSGTGTKLFGDNTVYGVGWNGDKGTATKDAIYDKIELVIAAGGAPNAFATITGITNDVVADNNADTLTLAAVGGLTIVGTAATDTITLTNTITQYTDGLAVAAVEAAGLTMANPIAMGANNITLGAGQLVDGKDVSTLCTTAEAHAFVEANALTLTADVTFNAGQLFDGKDVSGLCTEAEAHAYIEANALTLEQNLSFAGAQTVDGVDISAISITNMPTAVNNWKMYATNGAGIMTELAVGAAGTLLTGNGVGVAPSFQAMGAPAAHTHNTDTLQLDGINSNGGVFPFATTGSIGVDMVNAAATVFSITNSGAGVASLDVTGNITVSGTVDGVDIAARDHAAITVNAPIVLTGQDIELKNDAAAQITEIDTDVNLAGGDTKIPTDLAAKTYADTKATVAEAHAYVEANALTLEQNLSFVGAQTVDGVDISSIVAFKTITGITNDVVADSLTDTLTLAAVGGLTIVGNAGTDTITFTNTITQYTDVMVENIIIAELVNGQSIDNAIDALVHTRLHAMNSALDHSANTWNIFYSNAGGSVVELAVGAANTMLVGNGVGAAPSFVAKPVAGDFSHNSLANIDAGDIKHITAAQLGALHTRLHWMNSGSDHVGNAWNMYYTRADGDLIELALGADKTVLTSTGVAGVPAFETGAGHEHLEVHITDLDKYTQAQVDAALHTRLHWMNSGTDHIGNAWNIYYTRADGALIELALGADDTVLTSTGAAAIPAFEPFDAKAVQAVEDAGLILSASKSINIDGTPADATYTGIVMDIDTTGCANYDAVYIDGTNSCLPAKADAIGTMPAIGIVVAAGKVLTHGVVRHDATFAVATASKIYVSQAAAGDLTVTVPPNATNIVQVFGITVGADMIFVNPSLDWIVRV